MEGACKLPFFNIFFFPNFYFSSSILPLDCCLTFISNGGRVYSPIVRYVDARNNCSLVLAKKI